jgi:hypothetical protein
MVRGRPWVLLAGVLLLLAACSDRAGPTSASVAPAAAPERPPEAFYAVPDPLPPGPPGALIRATPIAGVPVLPDSDYQGLGTPGPARAAIGLSAGRAVLDMARAARGLQAAGAGGRVVLAGHSEGGHAVLWAAELARSYAPELQVLGVATSAPGAELAAGLKAEGSSGPATLTSGAMLLVVAWSDAYRVSLDVLTPAGRKAVDRVRTHCLLELAADPATPVVRPATC